MWWKIYFWVVLTVYLIGLFSYSDFAKFTIGDWLGLIISLILIIGTYSFAFSKKILSSKNWKAIFWIMIAFMAVNILLGLDTSGSLSKIFYFLKPSIDSTFAQTGTMGILLGLVLTIPNYYAIYKLAYRK